MRTSNRDPVELHARLGAWFARTLGPGSNPRLSPLTSPGKAGMSSETLLFELHWNERGSERSGRFVARLPPPADAFPLFPRYDFDLQVEAMRLVGRHHEAPVPRRPGPGRPPQGARRRGVVRGDVSRSSVGGGVVCGLGGGCLFLTLSPLAGATRH